MSDTDKERTDSPKEGDSDAKPSGGGAVVISIEQARAELLAKPRQRATPQLGVARARPRAREVPAPVTLPPGEHAAVIVTDTPAARAHVDKKTVHPGEMPTHTHEKKVRVKTSLDPRRAKTQLSDRRGVDPSAGPVSQPPPSDEHASQWSQPAQPPSVPPPSIAPVASVPSRRSLVRPKPIPRDKGGVPLFVVGVILAAALGATVVYLLSRNGGQVVVAPPATTAAAPPATAAPPASTPAVAAQPGSTATAAPSTTATAEPAVTAAAPTATASTPTATASTPVATRSTGAAVKPTAAATSTPTATAKPTATSVLPFGVGHD